MDLDYYHDPAIPEDRPTWLYGIAPVGYELPAVQHEIIEEAYIPEDDEDELDVLALKLTGNLHNETINGREFMSADLTDRELLGIFSRRYHPSGRILVSVINDRGERGKPEPVRNADIIVRTFWLSRHVTTNDEGDYYLHKRYKDRAAIRLSNRNPLCYVSRTWTEHIGLWMSDKIGEGKANLRIVIEQDGDNHRWYKATVNNVFQDYDKFARENGIPRPWRVHTYILGGQASSAPMLNRRFLTFYSAHFPSIASQSGQGQFGKLVRNVGIGMGTALVDVMNLSLGGSFSHYPDITIGMKRNPSSYKRTNDIRSAVFHELAHYSHRKQISAWYWANVHYQAMFDPTNGDNDYGDGTASCARYTAVAEAWSHFVERDLMWNLYGISVGNGSMTAYATDGNKQPYSETVAYPVGSTYMAKWIPSGLFKDLMDKEENPIRLYDKSGKYIVLEGVDKVSGLTYHQLFNLLTDEVRSIPQLRDKIIRLYPHKNRNNEITNLFKYYGY